MQFTYASITVDVVENEQGEWSCSAAGVDGTAIFKDVPYHYLGMIMTMVETIIARKEQEIGRSEHPA